jgi:translocation and assembly module TamB
VDASLIGQVGHVDAHGFVTLQSPKWGAEDLLLRFSRLDLAALTGRRLPSSLNGEVTVTGNVDTMRAPEGDIRLILSSSRIKEFTLDSVSAVAGLHDSLIRLDTAYAVWKDATLGGSGTLGWGAPYRGRMAFTLTADSLIAFDSLMLAETGQTRDPALDHPLAGNARAAVVLSGSLDTLESTGDLMVESLEWQRIRSPLITGAFSWIGGKRPQLTASLGADTLAAQNWIFHRLGAQARGWADSLEWGVGSDVGKGVRVDGAGSWWRNGRTQVAMFDSLVFGLPSHRYRLDESFAVTLSDSAPAISPLTLRAEDGSGTVQVAGRVPGSAPGSLVLRVLGLDLHDAYGLLQRDTTGVSGEIGLDVRMGGTAEMPTLRGTTTLDGATFGDFRAPFLQGVVNYADRRLETDLRLWKTGENVLDIEASLPLDLALRGAAKRQVDGPLSVHARGDSVDLGIIEALSPAVRSVKGVFSADVTVSGTWDVPRLAGAVDIGNGAMTVPGLGVSFGSVQGRARFQGDSLVFDNMALTSGGGDLGITGSVRLENLARPILNLNFRASQFTAVDVKRFLSLTATGALRLQGPLFQARLTGGLTANSGVLYFADLVSKRIIDLEDPTIADLVDTTLLRRENLGAKFQNRFLDSLSIENLDVEMGSDVWLRSAEANIQLTGQIQLSKTRQAYTPSGTLEAVRGSYTLKIGPVTRDFTVERGQVRYFGDLNAALDIRARHVVRAIRGEEIPVIAVITGTLYAPNVRLESTFNPPISQTDLVSYLVTGYPANEAAQLAPNALETGLSYFSSALSSELERALIQDIGIPLDLIEIRPGVSRAGGGSTLTQVAAGWQLGQKTFLTFNAGFCPENLSQFSYNNLGASLEFRFSREWRLQLSMEPSQFTCRREFGIATAVPYQVGSDLLWEREF